MQYLKDSVGANMCNDPLTGHRVGQAPGRILAGIIYTSERETPNTILTCRLSQYLSIEVARDHSARVHLPASHKNFD